MGKDSKGTWRKKARQCLAEAFGGKCTICGYDKTISALDYHHVDKNSKNKMLCKAMRNGHAWKKIVEEARKCTIVCCRCHREIHAGVTELPKKYAKFNEEYVDIIKLKKKVFDACPICGKEKYNKLKYCSGECFSVSQQRFVVTKKELRDLIREKPYEEIGRMFGVSGNAVKKRCKLLKLNTKIKRGYWAKKRRKDVDVSFEELKELLQKKSVSATAEMFGVSYVIMKRKIEELGVEIPDINWKKIAAKSRWS